MKTRNNFITNSSSTNFIFGFRGTDIDELYNAIIKHDCFDLLAFDLLPDKPDKDFKYSDVSCNSRQIADTIKEVYIKGNGNDITIINPSYAIKLTEKELKRNIKDEKKLAGEGYGISDYYENVCRRRLMFLREMERNGMSMLEIQFGDHGGHISGPGLGAVMDYEGRKVELVSEDLIIFTEQNR